MASHFSKGSVLRNYRLFDSLAPNPQSLSSIFLKNAIPDAVAKYQQALAFICQRETALVPFSDKVTLVANDEVQSKLALL